MSSEPLILLPGLLCDHELWTHQASALAAIRPVLIPDLTRHDTMSGLVDHVLSCTSGRFAVAGLSMGGYLALAVARAAPERVTHLCLMATGARPDSPEQTSRRRGHLEMCNREPPEKFRGVTPRMMPQIVHPTLSKEPALVASVMNMAVRIGLDGFNRQQAAIIGRTDSRDFLPGVNVPTTVIVGDSDQVTPPELAHEMAGLVPGAVLKIIETCGHLPPLERPEQTTQAMREWLTGQG